MRHCLILVCGAATLCGSAVPLAAGAHAKGDPFEAFNRANFNGTRSFGSVIRPVLAAYRRLTPGVIGRAIHNLLVNLKEPVVALNDFFQLRIGRGGDAAARFAFNSTLGVGGLIDVAGAAGNLHHDNGFGDTLGRYGVGPGPYLFLPLLGPSTLRDLFGAGVDQVSSPMPWVQFPYHTTVTVGLTVIGGLDAFSAGQGDLDALLAGAADPYATLRSAYLQNRQGEIDEGRAPAALPDLDEQPSPPPAADTPATDPQGAARGAVTEAAGPQASAGGADVLDLDAPIATAAL